MIRDARKWEVDPERTASEFDAVYYRRLLEKAWGEAAFVFEHMTAKDSQFDQFIHYQSRHGLSWRSYLYNQSCGASG